MVRAGYNTTAFVVEPLRFSALMPQTGAMSGAGAVMVAVPGGSVAYMLGAVTGIESKAVIDGTSLSGAMSQDRFALRSVHQGARRGQGANPRAGGPCRPYGRSTGPRLFFASVRG